MGYVSKVTVGNSSYPVAHTLYGTCTTAAGTAAKVVTCADFDVAAANMPTGLTIKVKFTNSNTAANPTLNINSKGAVSIYKYGSTVPGTTAKTSWNAGAVISFTYDGTGWIMNDWLNDDTTTDNKVTQNPKTDNVEYKVLLSYSNSDSAETNTANKNVDLHYNASTDTLTVADASSSPTKGKIITKDIEATTINGVTVGSDPKFTDTVYSAGTGISLGGTNNTVINHSNSITAKTTQAIYPTKIDAQGHVTATGTGYSVSTTVDSNSTDAQLPTAKSVYTAIAGLPEPMVFKGTLGTGGTITALPTPSSSNEGWTYKVITAGSYTTKTGVTQDAKVGDMFCCATLDNGTTYEWIYIPSGDDIEDTWRPIQVKGEEKLNSGINSGAINFIQGTNTDVVFTAASGSNAASIKINATDTNTYVSAAAFADNTSSDATNPLKMTLSRSGTVTTAVTANLPKVSSSTAGVAPKGAAVSSQSQSTKFLREDGTWAAPSYTTNTNTWRPIQVDDTDYLTDSTTKLDLVGGDNVELSKATIASGVGKVTISTPDVSVSTSGSGNAVTAIAENGHGITVTKGTTFLTTHQTIKQDGVTGATVNRFGTCSTAAGTAAKTVSITTGTYSLEAGARVAVKFTNANTADNPTLAVGNTAAKNIYQGGSQITTGEDKKLLKGVCEFIYDGTQYHLISSGAVTGVKGSAESTYRTGDVDISPANLGLTAATPTLATVSGGVLTLTGSLSNYVHT